MTTEEYLLPVNLFDRLVEVETTGPGQSKIVPGLADKWDVSADGKVYKFSLHPGVKFHNGEVLTADDVVYTFDRMLNPKTKALNTDFLDMIDGAKERMAGKADTSWPASRRLASASTIKKRPHCIECGRLGGHGARGAGADPLAEGL